MTTTTAVQALIDPVTITPGITGPRLTPKAVHPAHGGERSTRFHFVGQHAHLFQNGNPVVLDGNALLSDPELDLFWGQWQMAGRCADPATGRRR